jgi:hypothetical protein
MCIDQSGEVAEHDVFKSIHQIAHTNHTAPRFDEGYQVDGSDLSINQLKGYAQKKA